MNWHTGERFDVSVGDSRPLDAGHTKGTVFVTLRDKTRPEGEQEFSRVGRWEQIGNFSPIWVTIANQVITVETLLTIPMDGDLIDYGETNDEVLKDAKFVSRFRYRAPNAEPHSGDSLFYVKPGSFIEYRESEEHRRLARVLDRPIYDGCDHRLEGIWLRVLALSEDMNSGYQRYVKIDDVTHVYSVPTHFAAFFFATELPEPNTVISMEKYGSLTERYILKAMGEKGLRSDRIELEILRTCVARVAQSVGADMEKLGVTEKVFQDLTRIAETQDRGWNALCADICDKIDELKRTTHA